MFDEDDHVHQLWIELRRPDQPGTAPARQRIWAALGCGVRRLRARLGLPGQPRLSVGRSFLLATAARKPRAGCASDAVEDSVEGGQHFLGTRTDGPQVGCVRGGTRVGRHELVHLLRQPTSKRR